MIDQGVVNFIKEGKRRGFSVNLLKQKLLERGFNERDVDEAIKVTEIAGSVTVNNKKPQAIGPQKTIDSSFQTNKQSFSGTRWMKIASWCGVLLLIFSFLFSFFNSFFPSFFENILISAIILVIFGVLIFFYYFGFVKLGKSSDSKLLRIAAIMIIALLLAGIVSLIVLYLTIASAIDSLIVGTSGLNLGAAAITVLVILALIILLCIVSHVLFAIGLIKAGKKVRFAKAAGVLNIIAIIFFGLIILGVVAFAMSSLQTIMESVVTGSGENALDLIASAGMIFLVLLLGAIVASLLKLSAFILEILALFNGSKNFEQN